MESGGRDTCSGLFLLGAVSVIHSGQCRSPLVNRGFQITVREKRAMENIAPRCAIGKIGKHSLLGRG